MSRIIFDIESRVARVVQRRGQNAPGDLLSCTISLRSSRRGMSAAASASGGQLDHLEVSLGDAAIRAAPIARDVFPASSGSDALIWHATRFIVDEATNDTLPSGQ
jgi:hypothetical protein